MVYNISKLCSTCLSVDRNLTPLSNVEDKSIIADWFDNVNLDDMKICWECNAMFKKINKFKTQVFKAQKIRFRVAQKKLRNMITLSNLTTYTKYTYDNMYKERGGVKGSNSFKKKAERKKDDSDHSGLNNGKKFEQSKNGNANVTKHKEKELHPKLDVNIDIEKYKINYKNVSTNEKRREKRKHENGPQVVPNVTPKRAKREKKFTIANTDSNVAAKEVQDSQKINEYKSEIENKFIVHNLNEEDMLKTREADRNSPKYQSRAFKCEKCILGYFGKQQFDKHLKEKHYESAGPHMCPLCKTRFNRGDFLKYHFEGHYRSYRCKQCDYEHHKLYAMEAHFAKEHGRDTKYDCKICGMEFDSKPPMKYHNMVIHKQLPKCNHCGKFYGTNAGLNEHLKLGCVHNVIKVNIRHPEPKRGPGRPPKKRTCNICQMVFSNARLLKAHISEHKAAVVNPAEKIVCPCCSKQFRIRSALLNHIRTHTGEKPFECEQCHKRFAVKYTLKKHVQTRHQDDDNN